MQLVPPQAHRSLHEHPEHPATNPTSQARNPTLNQPLAATGDEGVNPNVAPLQSHCLCPAGGSCDICRTELITTTEAFASNAERETVIRCTCALDLEVHLKSENKCLHVQVIALEEHTTDLQNEISKLRQSQPKLKASGSNPQGQPNVYRRTKHASKSPSKSAKPLP